MTGIDRRSFGVLRDFLECSKPRQAEVTVQEAIVRPGGFASYQHFSDWFRRKAGTTAEEWRRGMK